MTRRASVVALEPDQPPRLAPVDSDGNCRVDVVVVALMRPVSRPPRPRLWTRVQSWPGPLVREVDATAYDAPVRVAIASCTALPPQFTDDLRIAEALAERGVSATPDPLG